MNKKIKEKLKSGIQQALHLLSAEKGWDDKEMPEVGLELPRDAQHGDLSSNIALSFARVVGEKPREIAFGLQQIIEERDIFPKTMLEKMEVAGPGFINFYLSEELLYEELKELLENRKTFGQSDTGANQKIHFEFVSANPTGPLNVVSARAAAVGDTLHRMLGAIGFKVFSEYYINDAGNQVRLLGKSVEARYQELLGNEVVFPVDGYHGDYVKDIAQKLLDQFGKEPLKWTQEEREENLANEALKINVEGQKEILKRYRVHYDNWFSEKEMRERKDQPLEKVLSQLSKKKKTYTSEEALWFQSTEYGDDKDRVLVTKEGNPTYFLADVAYHQDKAMRKFERIVVLMGPDHHGYYPRVLAAMEALGYKREQFEFRLVQQVNLLRHGKAVKMSKRAGKLIEMQELLDEVGEDAARYFFILRKLDSQLDFDLDLAKEHSANNPVYYVQYAHARISSIFRKFEEETQEKVPIKWSLKELSRLKEREEVDLIKLLIHFPDLLEGAALAMEPVRIPNYLNELCTLFHSFYTKHRVRIEDESLRKARLALIDATQVVIRNALSLLGVSSPEKM